MLFFFSGSFSNCLEDIKSPLCLFKTSGDTAGSYPEMMHRNMYFQYFFFQMSINPLWYDHITGNISRQSVKILEKM